MNYSIKNAATELDTGCFFRHASEIKQLLFELTRNEAYLEQPVTQITDLMRSLGNNGSYVFFAQDAEGHFVGMATLVPLFKLTGFAGEVHDVIVHPDHQGQGLGKKLMERLIAEAQKLKMTFLTLRSNPDNPHRASAIELYKKLRFVELDGFMTLEFRS
jgi:GNAT superfamily N-acetyltransferase